MRDELARLRHRLEKYHQAPAVYDEGPSPAEPQVVQIATRSTKELLDHARRELREWSGGNHINELIVDLDDRIEQVDVDASLIRPTDRLPAVGESASSVLGLIVGRFGSMELESESQTALGEDRLFRLGGDSSTQLRAWTVPCRDSSGEMKGRQTLFVLKSDVVT